MPRPPSADPVKKITVSIPTAIYEKAKERMAEFGIDFSRYLQFLISSDARNKPNQLHRLFVRPDGSIGYSATSIEEDEVPQSAERPYVEFEAAESSRVAEGTATAKKAQPKRASHPGTQRHLKRAG